MEEWTTNLRKTYGAADGNLRLTKFMQFFVEIDVSPTPHKSLLVFTLVYSLFSGHVKQRQANCHVT
jgi:hypothetical protein